MTDVKDDLHRYLRTARQAFLWKLEGLSEYDVRRPLTPTGTNLLGLLKHLGSVEIGYFGFAFGREFPGPMPWNADDSDEDNNDMWARAHESRADVIDFYGRATAFADETIEGRPGDSEGRVPWWPEERAVISLNVALVHLLAEVNRHLGQADIVRELIDESVGHREGVDNMPEHDAAWWAEYRQRVENAAREAARITSP